jgi:hypothetical protein
MQQLLNTFTPGIINALWNYDKPVISSILLEMYELHIIDGIQVFTTVTNGLRSWV